MRQENGGLPLFRCVMWVWGWWSLFHSDHDGLSLSIYLFFSFDVTILFFLRARDCDELSEDLLSSHLLVYYNDDISNSFVSLDSTFTFILAV